MRSSILALIAITFGIPTFSSHGASADDPRYAAALQAYVAGCTPDLSSQGMSPQKAEAVCACVFSGIAAEVRIGTAGDAERFKKIMQTQPDPKGSSDERRLYSILSDCLG